MLADMRATDQAINQVHRIAEHGTIHLPHLACYYIHHEHLTCIISTAAQLNLPHDVTFLFSEACSSQHAGAFTKVTHKVVTEVEGHRILISVQPPMQHTTKTHIFSSSVTAK